MNCSLCKYRSTLLGFENEVGLPQVSHHHHVEGLIEGCKLCERECTGECELENKELSKEHTHQHCIYPNSQHPLGPVTLRKSKLDKI